LRAVKTAAARSLADVVERERHALLEVAASAVAAGLAWFLARWLLGHPQPLFAAISAIVCLAPGLPSHRRQAVSLLIGVATGIAVGEVMLYVPEHSTALGLVAATFVAMAVASAYGLGAVVPIQAGVSAILVLAQGPQLGGVVRALDVVIGAGLGLFFSEVICLRHLRRWRAEAAESDLRRNGNSRSEFIQSSGRGSVDGLLEPVHPRKDSAR
jgi:uncharacterized membrane protein YgaE (UPF0421/DUF939 family)